MTSSPELSQHPDDSHHAGRAASQSGSRTPRRVQWASHDTVGVDGNTETSPRSSMHGLDEMGLDVCSCFPIVLLRRS
ncbi:hypothetical protein L210DRAFT_944473 [Boletus edulis BED1]|uniref:Uncharacterized protein n=1 Tax=Boletus edulis BED1 TaxID=1328754 RepID=A0AAD4BP16_BOLED|nr:hypothetical protein L210DRAFT_944473 [Boletus edulis BED1]